MNSAITSLLKGHWFKLICGASFHHLPSIRTLAWVYTLAGADCIDLAADPAIVEAAGQGIQDALNQDPDCPPPLLMASLNDGEDPHFRKAQITSTCPTDCPQPCLAVCPPQAIRSLSPPQVGVQIWADLCYGCGRCLPICPAALIEAVGYQRAAAEQLPHLWSRGIRALEIHTQVGRLTAFTALWQALRDWIPAMEAISISFGDGEGLQAYLWALVKAMQPAPAQLIWQVDGRPMSGDIGCGTTKATLRLAEKVSRWGLPGILQLAGGTNSATVSQIQPGLPVGGVAYGSYARQLVTSVLETGVQSAAGGPSLASPWIPPDSLTPAVEQARALVNQVKSRPCLSLEALPWPMDLSQPRCS